MILFGWLKPMAWLGLGVKVDPVLRIRRFIGTGFCFWTPVVHSLHSTQKENRFPGLSLFWGLLHKVEPCTRRCRESATSRRTGYLQVTEMSTQDSQRLSRESILKRRVACKIRDTNYPSQPGTTRRPNLLVAHVGFTIRVDVAC